MASINTNAAAMTALRDLQNTLADIIPLGTKGHVCSAGCSNSR